VRNEEEGQPLPINSPVPVDYENEQILGKVLFMHRPHPEPENGDWPYADYFATKKRRWELRLQGVLKSEVEQIFFGAELAEPLTLTWGLRRCVSVGSSFVNALSSARGVWLHGCAEANSEERQHLVWPLFAADVLICTPAGQTPPCLTEPFEVMPLRDRQKVRFNTADTYTFVYYTQYIDYWQWKFSNMPAKWMNSGFDEVFGSAPLNLVAYTLGDQNGGHTQANKNYLARLVFTSTPLALAAAEHVTESQERRGEARIGEATRLRTDTMFSLLACFSWCGCARWSLPSVLAMS